MFMQRKLPRGSFQLAHCGLHMPLKYPIDASEYNLLRKRVYRFSKSFSISRGTIGI